MGFRLHALSSFVALTALSCLFNSAFAQSWVAPFPTPLPSNAWSKTLHPSSGRSLPIGFYSYGCIGGAVALPQEGSGFQVMRPFRNRYYGDPKLTAFLKNLGSNLEVFGSGILVGDLGQPRGGPLPYGHASHQTGLDVDVWYWTHPEQNMRSLSADERNLLPMPSVLNANGIVDPALFTHETILKLKLAALSPEVERIFVNPAIKTYLCQVLPEDELYWLHALRPWPGHDDHFHVRLSCPAGDTRCIHQDPQAAGNGCKEILPDRVDPLDIPEMRPEINPRIEQILAPALATALPAACAAVLRE